MLTDVVSFLDASEPKVYFGLLLAARKLSLGRT